MNVVLIGFMCSGKTRVGRLVAKMMGWPHYDTDELVSKEAGRSVSEIIKEDGEAAFRDLERKAVESLSLLDNSVISTGGGVPLNPSNREALSKRGELVWLKVSPAVVLKRAGNLRSRPLIDPNDPLGSIQKRLEERLPAYQTAKHVIDSDHLAPQIIAEKVAAIVRGVRS